MNDSPSFTPVHSRIRTIGPQILHLAKGRGHIIYNESSGKLYFNANGDNKSFGSKGGLFAMLEPSPMVSSSDFILF